MTMTTTVTDDAVSAAPASAPASTPAPVIRAFAHFGLHRLIGRSSLTIAWLATDTRSGQTVRLLASTQPIAVAALRERCVEDAQRLARLEHPRLLPVREAGCVDRFPYLVCDAQPADLEASPAAQPVLGLDDAVRRGHDLLDGLAYVHEAGMVHGDIGVHTVVADSSGRLRLWGGGLGVALANARAVAAGGQPMNIGYFLSREIAACGLLMQHWLLGTPPAGEADMPALLERLASADLRLPLQTPTPVPESLRLIINRATDPHPQRRYLHARSFERVLGNWHQTQLLDDNGFDSILAERIRRGGHLPARPMLGQRVTQIANMEQQRLNTVVDVLLEDIGLSLAMLRAANSADTSAAAADEAVITVNRAMQLMGTSGLRRVASGMKAWPGTLKPMHLRTFDAAMNRALLAGHLAEGLAPGGMDAEAAQLAAQFQHLGRLLAAYHFPDELQQIARLKAAGDTDTGQPLSEETATLAVLGVDLPGLAMALLRLWGLTDALRQQVKPIPLDRRVQSPTTTAGWAKLVASCANEIVDIADQPQAAQPAALTHVLNRYHGVLALETEQVRAAMRQARDKLSRHLNPAARN